MEDANALSAPTPRMRRMQVTVLVLLVLGGVVNYLDRSALAIGNGPIRQELGLSATSMGVLLSAFLIAYAVAQIFVGFSIDRLGPRILLGIGMLVWSVAQSACGMVNSFTQFYVGRIVLGVGEAAQFPTGIRVVNNWFHISKRGLPTGIFNCSGFLGNALSAPLLTLIMLSSDWRVMFLTMGVLGIIMAIVWYALYRDPEVICSPEEVTYIRSGDTERTSSPVNVRQWARLFRFRMMWAAIIGTMGSQYLTWMYFTWLPGFLEIQQHISIGKTGIYAAIPAIAGSVGSIVGGYSTDWFGKRGVSPLASRKIPLVSGMVGMAAVTVATAFATDNGLVIGYISVAYFLGGLSSAAIWALVTAAAPPDYIGSFGSILLIGGYLGATCSPIITGVIVDATGSFLIALLIGAAMSVMGAAAFLLLANKPISGAALDGMRHAAAAGPAPVDQLL